MFLSFLLMSSFKRITQSLRAAIRILIGYRLTTCQLTAAHQSALAVAEIAIIDRPLTGLGPCFKDPPGKVPTSEIPHAGLQSDFFLDSYRSRR